MLSKRVSLFKAKNLAYNDFDYDDSLLFKPEFSRETLYIGIVFRIDGTSSIRLKNISVIGETINAFDDSDISVKIGLTGSPVNPNANNVTKAFYHYLKKVGASDSVLLGAHIREKAERLDKLKDENNYYSYLEYQLGYHDIFPFCLAAVFSIKWFQGFPTDKRETVCWTLGCQSRCLLDTDTHR